MEKRTRSPLTVLNMELYLVSQLKQLLDERVALPLEPDNQYQLQEYCKVVARMVTQFLLIQDSMYHIIRQTLEGPVKIFWVSI